MCAEIIAIALPIKPTGDKSLAGEGSPLEQGKTHRDCLDMACSERMGKKHPVYVRLDEWCVSSEIV